MDTISRLRPSPIVGRWYEANPQRLSKMIDGWLDAAPPPVLPGPVSALIAPHAGHIYSGAVAAHAFATVRGQSFDAVAVLSPFHNFHPAPILTSAHAAYITPLGEIEIDHTTLSTLEAAGVPLTRIANDPEHSLEIELPFLQRAIAGPFKLIPIMLRTDDANSLQELAAALVQVLEGRRALIVASTDLSHFYDAETARALDHEMLRRITDFDPASVLDAEQTGKGFACGHAAVAAALWAARLLGATHTRALHYATSGDITRDYASVVGYGAVVVTK